MIVFKGIQKMGLIDEFSCEELGELLKEMPQVEIKALLEYYKSKNPSDPRIALIKEKTSL
jgi:hypothetical protein|tara:strand:- start:165 stop:344 length:180 start_codon:yes stop_codon:yes gene_type:complete